MVDDTATAPATLAEVKAGDEVCIRSGWIRPHCRVQIVDKVTPTQIVVRGDRFKRMGGQKIGYSGTYLTLAASDFELANRQEVEESELREKARVAQLARDAAHNRHWDAKQRLLQYLDSRHDQPLRGADDEIHAIHTGTAFEASLRLSDLIEAMHWTPDRKRGTQEGETP